MNTNAGHSGAFSFHYSLPDGERKTAAVAASPALGWKQTLSLAAGAVACFHLAFYSADLSFLIVGFLYCLLRLAELKTARQAARVGLAIGLACYVPHLWFFWIVFKGGAMALWYVLAFWLALFVVLARACRARFGPVNLLILAPFLWTGLEYFRGELYYLRFSWMSAGYALVDARPLSWLGGLGVYGIGFAGMAVAGLFYLKSRWARGMAALLVAGVWLCPALPPAASASKSLQVAGVQMEFPIPSQVTFYLDQVVKKYPLAELLVLSEYSFDGPVPAKVTKWCRDHRKYLIAGGKDPLPNHQYYNTAFVIGPEGEVVFKQVKSVPVQFFADGLPAPERRVWDSPWGKIGMGVCYDASYRRVVDDFIAQGAQTLIFPTMDVEDWGLYQHLMNGRAARMRTAEYGVACFRVCSSGISQIIAPNGAIMASASFPGQGDIIGGELPVVGRGRLPLDHWLAPVATGITGLFCIWLLFEAVRKKRLKSK